MADKKPQPLAEAYITMYPGGYEHLLAIPARLASLILPELRHLEREYAEGKNLLKASEREIEIKLVSAEQMQAAILAGRLDGAA